MTSIRLLGTGSLLLALLCGCSKATSPQAANGVPPATGNRREVVEAERRGGGAIQQVQSTRAESEADTKIPEVSATAWLNCDGPQTLAALRGNVVLIECWATWCRPCVQGIPHMNEMHAHYADRGLRILSFTDETLAKVQGFQKRSKTPIQYPIGVGSPVSRLYGVRGIPHAIIVGRDGKPIWQGHPGDPSCEDVIVAALNVKTAAVETDEPATREE
ncbi:MAG: TlpA family protein disulfide reductase [Planctomycetes bacterium]|nr:TlpA family protein disulfide reductase [Planctomycetota bacterium]